MKKFAVLAATCVVWAVGTTAHAVIVFQDNFDSYFDGSGNPDQTAFTTAWTPIGCQGQGTPCTLNTSSTTSNEVSRDFADLFGDADPHAKAIKNHSPAAPSPGTADLAERNQITFPASPTINVGDKLSFSYDFYDLNPTSSPYRQFINLQSSLAVGATPAGQLVSIGLNNNQAAADSGGNYYMARILGYSNPTTDPDGGPVEKLAATNYVKLNDYDPTPEDTVADGPGARGTTAAWHNLKVEITTPDGVGTDYNFFVDGAHVEHVNIATSSPRTYTALRMGAGVSSTSDAYFDNILVEFTPAAVVALPGDFNSDSKVDAGDYATWRKNEVANAALANDNGLGTQAARFDLWRANFGKPPGAGSGLSGAAVPEPTTIGLMIFGLAAIGLGRRGRVA